MTETIPPMVSVVILNFNVRDFLEHLLVSLERASVGIETEIFVVDNASYDGSADMVKDKFPRVHLIVNDRNLGFSKGNNIALKQCRGKYILVINPDVVVQENTISHMIEFMELHPQTGAATCKVLNSDGTLQLACRRSFPTPMVALWKISGLAKLFPKNRHFGKYNLTYLDENECNEVEAISGSFMFLRRHVIDEIGGLDERFFMYGEDLDWCYRIHQAGWKIQYTPGTQIIHYKGESTKKSGFDDIRIFYEAMALFVEKHFKPQYSFLAVSLLRSSIWLRAAVSFFGRLFKIALSPILDLIMINISVSAGILLRYNEFIVPDWMPSRLFFYIGMHSGASIIWLLCLTYFQNYSARLFSISQSFIAALAGFFIVSTVTLFSKDFVFSRLTIVYISMLVMSLIPGWRLIFLILQRRGASNWLLTKRMFKKNVLLVGSGARAMEVIQSLNADFNHPYRMIGIIHDGKPDHEKYVGLLPVLGALNDLHNAVASYPVHEIIFCSETLSYNAIIEIITSFQKNKKISIKIVPHDNLSMIGKSTMERISKIPLIRVDYQISKWHVRFLKRLLDFVFGFLLFTTVSVFYILQRCTGRLTRKSLILNDRLSPRIIRMTSSDRPALGSLLWHVIRGDLSLVGKKMTYAGNGNEPNDTGLIRGLKYGIFSISDLFNMPASTNINPADAYYCQNYSFKLDAEIFIRCLFKI